MGFYSRVHKMTYLAGVYPCKNKLVLFDTTHFSCGLHYTYD